MGRSVYYLMRGVYSEIIGGLQLLYATLFKARRGGKRQKKIVPWHMSSQAYFFYSSNNHIYIYTFTQTDKISVFQVLAGRQCVPILANWPRHLPQRHQDLLGVVQRGGPSPPHLHAEGWRLEANLRTSGQRKYIIYSILCIKWNKYRQVG